MRNDNSLPLEDPHAALERQFIDEFLQSVGHTRRSVAELGTSGVSMLLRAASEYASLRLAEIECRARYTGMLPSTRAGFTSTPLAVA
jgi:hypothetical protein